MTTKHIPQIRLAPLKSPAPERGSGGVSLVQWWIEDIEGAINDIKNGKLPDIQPLMSVKSAIESCALPLIKQAAERDRLKESNVKLLKVLKEAYSNIERITEDGPESMSTDLRAWFEMAKVAIAKADPALERG